MSVNSSFKAMSRRLLADMDAIVLTCAVGVHNLNKARAASLKVQSHVNQAKKGKLWTGGTQA